ncbi:protein rapunzel [Aulostomus maculatus]
MEDDINEDRAKLKQNLCHVLRCVSTISSTAAVINPIFGVAGALIRVVLHHVDDEDIRTLKIQFGLVNEVLNQLSEQNRNTVSQIKKGLIDCQYGHVEENLKNQYRMFMLMVNAEPDQHECRKKNFVEGYSTDFGDQNLHTLFDGVVGKRKLFSRPILEVYMEHSQGNRCIMENLCKRLNCLFCIGLIAFMGYSAIIQDDEETLTLEWADRMEEVQQKMQEALSRCK